MSEFHYVRTLGPEGGVDAVEGHAVGVDLETLLAAGPPPFKVALEIIAAVCEILDIADEDGEVHGDLGPRTIRIDERGAVSVSAFGVRRVRSPAPEGVPRGTATDVYQLGRVALRLFTGADLALPSRAEEHENAVLDGVVCIDFSGLPEEMQRDVQWFLARALAFEPDDRPSALEMWRTFVAFAGAVPGPSLDRWSVDAAHGRAERRKRAAMTPSAPPSPAGLGGPVVSAGPLKRGGLSFDGGGGKPGQATAFWSRDQMKAALDAAEDEDDHRPAPGGGSATAFWSREQMQAMAEGRGDAPRPKRAPGTSEKSVAWQRSRSAERPEERPRSPSIEPTGPRAAPIEEKRAPPPPPPPIPAQPVAPRPEPDPDDSPEPQAGSKILPLVVGVVVVLVLAMVCAGLGAAGVGVAFWSDAPADAEPTTAPATPGAPQAGAPTTAGAEAPTAAGGAATTDPPAAAAPSAPDPVKATPAPAPAKPSTTESSSSKASTAPPKPAPPKPAPPPPPPPAGGPVKVTFRADQRGELKCSDGQSIRFDGPLTLEFPAYAGTVTCALFMDAGAKGYFQTATSANVSCVTSGADVSCTKS